MFQTFPLFACEKLYSNIIHQNAAFPAFKKTFSYYYQSGAWGGYLDTLTDVRAFEFFLLKFSFPMLNAALYNKRLQLFVANFVVANLLQILVEGEIYV